MCMCEHKHIVKLERTNKIYRGLIPHSAVADWEYVQVPYYKCFECGKEVGSDDGA